MTPYPTARLCVAFRFFERIADRRPPDFIVGGKEDPYMLRWWIIPRNRWFNVYLHNFLRSDDDRAHHDHPWWNFSILLRGEYTEHTIAAGGVDRLLFARRLAGRLRVGDILGDDAYAGAFRLEAKAREGKCV